MTTILTDKSEAAAGELRLALRPREAAACAGHFGAAVVDDDEGRTSALRAFRARSCTPWPSSRNG